MTLDTEANLQGEFYYHAKLSDLTVILELHTPFGRFDIAVMNPDRTRLLAIVECKLHHFLFMNGESAQIKRYKRVGVPVYGLSELSRVEGLVATIKARHGQSNGVLLWDLIRPSY